MESQKKETEKNTLPRWDLTEYYKDIHDPQIDKDLADDLAFAGAFEKKYKGKLASLTGDELAGAIREYEANAERPRDPSRYTSFMKTLHQTDPDVAALQDKVRNKRAETGSHMMFWGLEIKKLDPEKLEKMYEESAELAHYRPYLRDVLKEQPHTLSDEVELALQKRGPASASSILVRQFDELQAQLRFPFPSNLLEDHDKERLQKEGRLKDNAETVDLTLTEARHYRSVANEDARKAIWQSMNEVLSENTYFPTFIMNNMLLEKQIEDRERGYTRPDASMNLYNDVEGEVVDTLAATVTENFPDFSQRFLKLKAQMFGSEQLEPWNVFAPLPDEADRKISWEEAKTLVLDSYREFSPQMADIAQMFFDNNWIDAAPAPDKSGGAYSAPNRASAHPHIMMNFQGTVDDVMTLAHELGHGIHQHLAAQKQGDFMDGTPLTLAETASTFGEMLVFQKLLSGIEDPVEKKALLASKISDATATIAVQIAYHNFETEIHTLRQSGEIKAETYAELWEKAHKERTGDAIVEHPESGGGHSWGALPHIFHTPFYVYSYAFGDLLATSLYHKYTEEKAAGRGEEFAEQYISLLEAAGTEHHSELLPSRFGADFDARKAEFWQRGVDVYKEMINELEQLVSVEKDSEKGWADKISRDGDDPKQSVGL